jgi:hypothetical protein
MWVKRQHAGNKFMLFGGGTNLLQHSGMPEMNPVKITD